MRKRYCLTRLAPLHQTHCAQSGVLNLFQSTNLCPNMTILSSFTHQFTLIVIPNNEFQTRTLDTVLVTIELTFLIYKYISYFMFNSRRKVIQVWIYIFHVQNVNFWENNPFNSCQATDQCKRVCTTVDKTVTFPVDVFTSFQVEHKIMLSSSIWMTEFRFF